MKTEKVLDRHALENRFRSARSNLLWIVAFTVINIVLLVTNSNTYFLFSAYIPYFLVTMGMALCGMFPTEYYGEDLLWMEFLDRSVFTVFLVIAFVIVALYLISWIFSKNNKRGWLIFALVFFSLDTLGMFALEGFAIESIIDVVFHVWVIISLSLGIHACNKLKKMPIEEDTVPEIETTVNGSENLAGSTIIRRCDLDAKARVLLEGEVLGHAVVYRRVKRVNELVIDGNVYDEIKALVELPHSLKAEINGHIIEVGYDGVAYSYLKLDGELISKKIRIF